MDAHRMDGFVERKKGGHIVAAASFSTAMVALGAVAIAPLVGLVFASGFFGGFVLWLARPMRASFGTIVAPYVAGLVAYVVHRVDEEVSGFVPAIERLTGGAVAPVASAPSLLLVALSIAWMASPLLLRRGHPLGHYGAWTLFASFGVLELAHFVFPLLTEAPYGYFPGMTTAPLIVAMGWWGMWRMWRGDVRGVRGA